MDRRKFVSLSTAAVAEIAVPRVGAGQSIASVHIENPLILARRMPIDFTGLSYERVNSTTPIISLRKTKH